MIRLKAPYRNIYLIYLVMKGLTPFSTHASDNIFRPDLEIAHELAVALYDMPEIGDMPGVAEEKLASEITVAGKLKALNPGREHEIEQYLDSRWTVFKQGCVEGVRQKMSHRFVAEFKSSELKSLQEFSRSSAGSELFSALREALYSSSDAIPSISDSQEALQFLNGPTGRHFSAFHEKLMSNEDHWLREACEAGQTAAISKWEDGLKSLNLIGLTINPAAFKSGPAGFAEIDDPRYTEAVRLREKGQFAKAYGILSTLSKEGNISAKLLLAEIYYKGTGIPQDYGSAFSLFEEAAQANDVEGQYNLAVMYLEGQGTTQNSRSAFQWLERSARAGYPPSELLLADRYRLGDGVERDSYKALLWYRRAAEDGYAPAQDRMGLLYQQGDLVPQDYAEAAKWHEKAAQQGFAAGEFNLGRLYENGLGVTQDYSRSYELYKRAADEGLDAAQYGLGIAFAFGKGVPRDRTVAVDWYRKAANQGYAEAQFNLAVCYEEGFGIPKDMALAMQWYLEAANQGHGGAQFNLGFAYGLGAGVPVNLVEAYKWFALSASRPETKEPDVAIKNRDYAASQMTPAQLEQAKKLVADWKREPNADISRQ